MTAFGTLAYLDWDTDMGVEPGELVMHVGAHDSHRL